MKTDFLIAVYKVENSDSERYENLPHYAEIITFGPNGDNLNITPITEEAMSVLRTSGEMASLLEKYYFSASIPSNLLFVNNFNGDMIWEQPAKKVKINTGYQEGSFLNCFSGEIYYPGLIFLLKSEELFVYAVDGNKLYTLSIPHYSNDSGWVCLGECKESYSINERIDNYTNAFYINKFKSSSHMDSDLIDSPEKFKLFVNETYKSDAPWDKVKLKKLKKWNQTKTQLLNDIISIQN